MSFLSLRIDIGPLLRRPNSSADVDGKDAVADSSFKTGIKGWSSPAIISFRIIAIAALASSMLEKKLPDQSEILSYVTAKIRKAMSVMECNPSTLRVSPYLEVANFKGGKFADDPVSFSPMDPSTTFILLQ